MTHKQIAKKHPNKLVIAIPKKRNAKTKRVSSWTVLQTTSSVPECEKALAYYEQDEGMKEVVAFTTYEEGSHWQLPELSPKDTAKYYRVYLGTA